ncbi:MAG: class I SAM-dependent methyltransferase [Pirellulales bacterium]
MWNAFKSVLKRRCPRLVEGYRQLRRAARRRKLARKSAADIFSSIYHAREWGPHESASGAGSTLDFTGPLRRELPLLLRRLGVRRLLDAPCGDFHWMRHVPLDLDEYVGADIVPDLIASLRHELAQPGRRFVLLDLIREPLPDADALFCRDCLIHLSHGDCLKLLDNFRRGSIPWLITTTAPDVTLNEPIATGEFRRVNLCLPPFNLPPPLELLDDTGPGCPPRMLGVWRRDQIG